MYKLRTIRTVELFGLALILVAVLATAVYLEKMPVLNAPIPAANVGAKDIAQAPVSANPAAARSLYMSEQTLRRMLDDAYERHQTARVQSLLHILNARYEHRCCGLPR